MADTTPTPKREARCNRTAPHPAHHANIVREKGEFWCPGVPTDSASKPCACCALVAIPSPSYPYDGLWWCSSECATGECQHGTGDTAVACEWCGRAIDQRTDGRWYAVKGAERGYPPLDCDANKLDGQHDPGTPAVHGSVYLDRDTGVYNCADCGTKGIAAILLARPCVVTPSRTDRQPPASSSETKGGQGTAGSDA